MSKNASEPAYGFVDNRSSSYEDNEIHYGLTKRELIAAMMAQGLAATSVPGSHHMTKNLISEALELTDELLNQLSHD